MPKQKQVKILIAEDEKALSHILELRLSKIGFKVKIATDGKSALEALAKESFDLLMLDLIMPTMDGFEVLKQLNAKGKNLPVLVTTNLSQAEDRAKVMKLGAVGYLVKSDYSIPEIIANIERILKIKS